MWGNRPGNQKKNAALLILLAVLCVGGVELLACRYFAPELYRQITAPASQGWQAVTSLCQLVSEKAVNLYQSVFNGNGNADESDFLQLAGDPIFTDSAIVSDPSATELRISGEHEILTGGLVDITYFNQADAAWSAKAYGSDTLGPYGCGPVAMSMIVSSMTNQYIDPEKMAQWAAKQGYWAKRSGSYLSIVAGVAQAHGLQAESFSGRTPESLQDAILSGKMLVALMGPGHFTNKGHFILLRGVSLSGMILVADPSSRERSLSLWDAQLILDELSSSTSSGAPLWTVSIPVA